MENKEIVALGRTDLTKPVVVGDMVFDLLLRDERGEIVPFFKKRYVFLNLLVRADNPHDPKTVTDAAEKAGLDPEFALRYKDSEIGKRFLEDRILRSVIAEEAKNPDRWYSELYKVQTGEVKPSKAQVAVLEMLGARVAPPKKESGPSVTKIEINIDPDAIERSRARRQAIEAQIVSEPKSESAA